MKAKSILKIFLILIALALATASGLLVAANYLNKSPEKNIEPTTFTIRRGESLRIVAANLEKEGHIRSAFFLNIIARLMKTETLIKAGKYTLPPGKSTADLYKIILKGQQILTRITVPEGWTLKKTAALLEEKKIASQAEILVQASSREFLDSYGIPGENAEGYLFPDTYYFAEGSGAEIVLKTMIENFFKKVEEILPDYKEWDRQKLFEKITMASIIEREYRVKEEAVLIASVFYNRLKYRVGLESCATLEYIITDIQGSPHPEYITLKDKEIDSPYNTYKWHGLPPGPISNPGKTALYASFYPAKTDYWFFVLKDQKKGAHYFSKDLEEHVAAKYYFLKGYGSSPES